MLTEYDRITKTQDKMAVMQAFIDGEKIEYIERDVSPRWEEVKIPVWNWANGTYRVKKIPLVPDLIDWSHVHPDYKYMARDRSGLVYLYRTRPVLKETQWTSPSGLVSPKMFSSLSVGNVDWKDSLVTRPGI